MSNIGFCGKNCDTCLAYQATKKNDLQLLAKLSTELESQCDAHSLPHRYRCTGCLKSGVTSVSCQECKIRNCAMENKLVTCEFCPDFPCELHSVFSEIYAEYKHNTAQIKSR